MVIEPAAVKDVDALEISLFVDFSPTNKVYLWNNFFSNHGDLEKYLRHL